MLKKTTLSIYRSRDEGFSEEDLNKLAEALQEKMDGTELTIKSDNTPDGEEIMFIIGD